MILQNINRNIGASLGSNPMPFTPTIQSVFDAPQVGPLSESFVPYIYDQYQITDCGPETFESLVNQLYPGFVGSPKFVAKETRLLDNLGPEDGTDCAHITQALLNRGSCSLSVMPDNAQTDTAADYWSPNGITEAIAQSAGQYKIKGWGVLSSPSWDDLQKILSISKQAAIIINLGNLFYQDSNGNDTYNPNIIFPLSLGSLIGRHWIKIISSDVAQAYGVSNPNPAFIYFVNSWGTQYGSKGIGWFDESYISNVLQATVVY